MNETSATTTESAAPASDRYVIDGRASRITVQAFATGLLSAMGHNPTIAIRDVSGELKFDPETLEAGTLWIAIKSSSLSVQDDISPKDIREMERIMNQDVLETEKFPGIQYDSVDVPVTRLGDAFYSATLNGNLSLHGVTRREPIQVRVTLLGTMLRASGSFSLNQSDYNIKPVSVAGGALKLKNELRFSFEIVARKPD